MFSLKPKKEANPATTDVYSGGRSDTRNRWSRMEADYPGNRNDGRTAVMRTDSALQLGPPPDRIDATRFLNIRGKVSSHSATDVPAQRMYIGRVPLIHKAALPTPRKLSDDNAQIPATYVGNPV